MTESMYNNYWLQFEFKGARIGGHTLDFHQWVVGSLKEEPKPVIEEMEEAIISGYHHIRRLFKEDGDDDASVGRATLLTACRTDRAMTTKHTDKLTTGLTVMTTPGHKLMSGTLKEMAQQLQFNHIFSLSHVTYTPIHHIELSDDWTPMAVTILDREGKNLPDHIKALARTGVMFIYQVNPIREETGICSPGDS